jgi:hypothetical protein
MGGRYYGIWPAGLAQIWIITASSGHIGLGALGRGR